MEQDCPLHDDRTYFYYTKIILQHWTPQNGQDWTITASQILPHTLDTFFDTIIIVSILLVDIYKELDTSQPVLTRLCRILIGLMKMK